MEKHPSSGPGQFLLEEQGLFFDLNRRIQFAEYAPDAAVRPFRGHLGHAARRWVPWPLSGDWAQRDYERYQAVFGKEYFPGPLGEPYPEIRPGLIPPGYRYPALPANACTHHPYTGIVAFRAKFGEKY